MKKNVFIRIFAKTINFLVPKSRFKVYVVPHPNCLSDQYDLLNYSSDNVLNLLHFWKNQKMHFKSVFYIECYSLERMRLLREEIKSYPFKIKLVLSHINDRRPTGSLLRRFKNALLRYRCKTWISDTGNGFFCDKLKNQVFICLSYSTPLKVGGCLMPRHMRHEDWSYIDHFLETSLLTACVHSAENRFKLEQCPIVGFPRNDNLMKSNKKEKVMRWINSKAAFPYKKIIVYVPTYRDYEGAFSSGCVLGFRNSASELEEFLEKEQLLLITKFHPLQKEHGDLFTKRVIRYEKNWDFSLYDLLSVCDLLISDYSSVIHDFVLTGKPIIIDAFDYEKYKDTRGFAFEPLEFVLPSSVSDTFEKVIDGIKKELQTALRDEQYALVKKTFHRYPDFNSCERVTEFLKQYIR